jgi:hypothetical protein
MAQRAEANIRKEREEKLRKEEKIRKERPTAQSTEGLRRTKIANCAASVTRFTLRNTHTVTNAVNAIITTNTRKGKNMKAGGAIGKEAAALAAEEEEAAAAATAAAAAKHVV